jgi:hypothetical protein
MEKSKKEAQCERITSKGMGLGLPEGVPKLSGAAA